MAFDLKRLVSKGGMVGHHIYISHDLDVVFKNKIVGKLTLDAHPNRLPEDGFKNYPVYDHPLLLGKCIYIVGNENFPAFSDVKTVDTVLNALYLHICRILGTKP